MKVVVNIEIKSFGLVFSEKKFYVVNFYLILCRLLCKNSYRNQNIIDKLQYFGRQSVYQLVLL